MHSVDWTSHSYICFVVIVAACCHAEGNNKTAEENKGYCLIMMQLQLSRPGLLYTYTIGYKAIAWHQYGSYD